MKKLVISCAVLALSAGAFAQSSVPTNTTGNFELDLPTTNGGGNASLVSQQGRPGGIATGNYAKVDQDGRQNQALVEQLHNNHRAVLEQEGKRNEGEIKQRAAFSSNPPYPTKKNKWSNDHEMKQDGDRNESLIVSFNDDNWGRVDIEGDRNETHMGQSTNGVGNGNFATQYVTGNRNVVRSRQTRDNNRAYQEVEGDKNTLSVRQVTENTSWKVTAQGNHADIYINGDRNRMQGSNFNAKAEAGVWQIGQNNRADVSISGDDNDAKIDQYNSDMDMNELKQFAQDNRASLTITGDDNYSRTDQDGDGNTSHITVSLGDNNTSYATQHGDDNFSRIQQGGGNGSVADVDQLGDDNTSFVNQNGYQHTSTTWQNGDNNYSNVTQSGL